MDMRTINTIIVFLIMCGFIFMAMNAMAGEKSALQKARERRAAKIISMRAKAQPRAIVIPAGQKIVISAPVEVFAPVEIKAVAVEVGAPVEISREEWSKRQ